MLGRIGANKAFYILFGVFALALYILFSLINKIAPLAISHTVYYCQKALSNILLTLPHLTPSILVLALTSIILIGLSLLAIQLLKTQLFIRKILKNKVATTQKINKVAEQLRLADHIDVVRDEQLLSFC